MNTNQWAGGAEKKNNGKSRFAKGAVAALIMAVASLTTLAGCPQDGNGLERPAEPIHINRDGIDFRTRGEFTPAQTAAITGIINNLDLAAFVGYVHSLTIVSQGAPSIALTETDKAVIYTGETTREGIIAALTAGREAAYAARNPYTPTPGPDYIDTNIGGIAFRTAGNMDFTEEQVAAIQARIDELDEEAVADFAEYVERVTFGQGVETGRVIYVDYTAGKQATAVIYIEYNATAAEIMDALTTAQAEVEAVRNVDTSPEPFHVFTDGAGNELRFYAEESFGYAAALAWLTHPGNQAFLSGIPRYVASLTIKSNVDGGRQIRLGEDDRAVVISDGSESLEEDLEWGLVVGMGLLPPTHNGPAPEPFHVFTDAAGNELSFFAEAGFDYSAALIWLEEVNPEWLAGMSPYVASLTLKSDVDGDREIRLGGDDRAVVVSDGSNLQLDLTWGRAVAQGHFPPTHTMMNAIKAQIANVGGATVTEAQQCLS